MLKDWEEADIFNHISYLKFGIKEIINELIQRNFIHPMKECEIEKQIG